MTIVYNPQYKGYTAEVEFDDSVGRLHGRVTNCGPYPVATLEATDVDGIRREFHCSIDEYLKSCREDRIEPRKSYSGKLNVRFGLDLHQRPCDKVLFVICYTNSQYSRCAFETTWWQFASFATEMFELKHLFTFH